MRRRSCCALSRKICSATAVEMDWKSIRRETVGREIRLSLSEVLCRERMDESFLLMLSSLLHLHNHQDPTSSLLSDIHSPTSTTSAPSSPSLLTSTSAAPLLFFTIASVLSYLASSRPLSSSTTTSGATSSAPAAANDSNAEFCLRLPGSLHRTHLGHGGPTPGHQWRSSYGLSYPVFSTVVDKLKPYITQSNLSLPSDYAVAMVLSRLTHGFSAKTLASRYSLEPYLISKITNMVIRLLATKLYPEFIKIPVSRGRLHETTQAFEEITSLPNMCGAIDGTLVKLRRLPADQNPSTYRCRYGHPAVLLQVVADHKKIFWDVCVKGPGGFDDAAHLRDSLLYNRLTSGDVVWDNFMNVRGHHVRPYIAGDCRYPLLSFLLTPFTWNGTGSPAQNEFDAALMKGRKAVEEAIGLLKGRWKILQDLNVGLNHALQTIVACCVLHNLCQIAREPEPELWKEPEASGPPPRALENEKSFYYFGESLRQALADDLYQRLSR